MSYTRFAVYYVPDEGALAAFGAQWLGWDVAQGRPVAQPDLPYLKEATQAPRKYGFHGTLKPPFRLAEGSGQAALQAAVSDMAAGCAPAQCDGLALSAMGRFLALTPQGDPAGIGRVAATCVRAIDGFRAPLAPADLERRRASGLSARQEELLQAWGYPYVMEQFRFHLTLTGRLPKSDLPDWITQVTRHLPPLPVPFALDQVALVGERQDDGRFEVIQRYALSG